MTPVATDTTPAKPKFWRAPAFRIGVSALVLVLLLTFVPFNEVWTAIKRIPPSLSLGLLVGYLALHLVGVAKWRLLINAAGAELTFAQAARCYYGGLFGNVFLPSLVGGDVVRAGMAFAVSPAKAAILLGSLIDRTEDVIGLGAVAGLGTLLLPRSLDPQSRKVFWAFGGALAAAGLVGLAILFATPVRKFPYKVRRMMVKLRSAGRSMYNRPGRLLLCLCMGMILQGCQVVINYWLGEASGLHIAFGVWLFAWPLAKLSALLPVTQGGIGVREVALVGLLAPFGAATALTAAAGLVFEAITTFGNLIAGGIAFVLGRVTSGQAKTLTSIPQE
ncbi:MAG TPA: lysylphosphatidylglycerol synthase transmembrane domain-containing protein [Bryobacteraceae bacterium]|jgi:uncharacterized membrane protein YbhN (UPF0104 family)